MIPARPSPSRSAPSEDYGRIKCIVWDLDNTLWDGVLLENASVELRPEMKELIVGLDQVGVLHSIASRNDFDTAMHKLREFGIADYFLHPQIGWTPKSDSINRIATALNLGTNAFAFVDDDAFERAEVASVHPAVTCVDVNDVGVVVKTPPFTPRFVTAESRLRRQMYQGNAARQSAQSEFAGTNEDFLATLKMVFTIREAVEDDLRRAEELTVRTNQLQSTGNTYSFDQLAGFIGSPKHLLLVAGLTDVYGSYGTIGLALVERAESVWSLKLLLMSCRVMSRGVGTVLLHHVMRLARDASVALRADFVPTNRNRVMYVTYRFAGFREVDGGDDLTVLEADLDAVPEAPGYLTVVTSREN